jgi:hypothetical protein
VTIIHDLFEYVMSQITFEAIIYAEINNQRPDIALQPENAPVVAAGVKGQRKQLKDAILFGGASERQTVPVPVACAMLKTDALDRYKEMR